MDPFTALGLAAAVVQFTDFGSRFARNMMNMYKPNAKLEDDYFFEKTATDLNQTVILLKTRSQKAAGTKGAAKDPNEVVSISCPTSLTSRL